MPSPWLPYKTSLSNNHHPWGRSLGFLQLLENKVQVCSVMVGEVRRRLIAPRDGRETRANPWPPALHLPCSQMLGYQETGQGQTPNHTNIEYREVGPLCHQAMPMSLPLEQFARETIIYRGRSEGN